MILDLDIYRFANVLMGSTVLVKILACFFPARSLTASTRITNLRMLANRFLETATSAIWKVT